MNALFALAQPPAGVLHRVRRFALACTLLGATAAGWAQAAALPAVVVWDFDNQTAVSTLPAERIDYLRRSLSENLTVTLLQVQGLPVVERQRLKDLLAEQGVRFIVSRLGVPRDPATLPDATGVSAF